MFKKLFAAIGGFFKGLFNAAEKAWDKLSPEIKTAFEQGSGILDIINKKVDEAPDAVFQVIQQVFPKLSEEALKGGLVKVAQGFGIGNEIASQPDVKDVIAVIQKYLNDAQGQEWAKWSSFGAKVLASFFAPDGTKWSIFELLMEVFFQKKIKNNTY